ncbi:MAG: hypothetical protein Q9221_000735 [Calogaya cf. arnoldii]
MSSQSDELDKSSPAKVWNQLSADEKMYVYLAAPSKEWSELSEEQKMDVYLMISHPNLPSEKLHLQEPSSSSQGSGSTKGRFWFDIELDYDEGKLSEEERQQMRDGYADIEDNSKGYLSRVPHEGLNVALNSEEAATPRRVSIASDSLSLRLLQGASTATSSQQADKKDKGVDHGTQSSAPLNTDELEKKAREKILSLRLRGHFAKG